MMSNYKKLDDFEIYWAKELIFVQIRNNLIFIKNKHEPGWGSNLGALHKTKWAPQIAILIKISSLLGFDQ